MFLVMSAALVLAGCRSAIIDRTDRGVYRLIQERQSAALGATSDATLAPETGEIAPHKGMYSFVPGPIDSGVPESFQHSPPSAATAAPDEEESASDDEELARAEEMSPGIFSAEEAPLVKTLGLNDVLAYAMRHARQVQDAKEDLYIAALDLTLERHLWTPQFVVESLRAEYTNDGQGTDFDQALSAVSTVAVSQRLPLGGEVTASVINELMRDLSEHVTSGESGSVILEASVPLFRGAGRVAYESRYVAERELIYAVRSYEDFRRSFAVRVAGQYFALQQRKAAIGNAFKSYAKLKEGWERADFINRMGRSRNIFDAPRARSSLRSAESVLVTAKEAYASALDRFKILIGMAVEALLDVIDQEEDLESQAIELLLTDVDVETATAVALHYRLDLLTSSDRVDDTRRGVVVAKNRILPDLTLTGSVGLDSDPDHLSSAGYNLERSTWQATAEFQLDDRKTERNAYRAALVALRRAGRDHELLVDTVRADVRRALRRIHQQRDLLEIQDLNVDENELRYEAAQAQFELGIISNRDVVDADTDLLRARNNYANALAAYRNAILEFRRDTATLRVDDNGQWTHPVEWGS